jgi:hypothetical protein
MAYSPIKLVFIVTLFSSLLVAVDCPVCGNTLFRTPLESNSQIKQKYECVRQHSFYLSQLELRQMNKRTNDDLSINPATPKPMTKKDAYASMGFGLGMLATFGIIKGIKKLKEMREESEIYDGIYSQDSGGENFKILNAPIQKTEGELYWDSLSAKERERIEKENERFFMKAILLVVVGMVVGNSL